MYLVTIQGTANNIIASNATHTFVKLADAVDFFNQKADDLNIPTEDIEFLSEDSAYTRCIGHDYSLTLIKQ